MTGEDDIGFLEALQTVERASQHAGACWTEYMQALDFPIGYREGLMLARKNDFVAAEKALDAAVDKLLQYDRKPAIVRLGR